MDPCAGLHIMAHGSIPLPYLPTLGAVLRPAPLASYYFPIMVHNDTRMFSLCMRNWGTGCALDIHVGKNVN